jgi:hypothetical protein
LVQNNSLKASDIAKLNPLDSVDFSATNDKPVMTKVPSAPKGRES